MKILALSDQESLGLWDYFDARRLEGIDFIRNAEFVGEYAFSNCSSLTSLDWPESMPVIKQGVFSGCSRLRDVRLPENIESIASVAFSKTPWQENTAIIENGGIYIGDILLINMSRIKDKKNDFITYYPWNVKEGTRVIAPYASDPYAFHVLSDVKELKLPEGIEIIGEGAFRDCSHIKSIEFPEGLKKIGDRAFESCYNLEKVRIPESVTYIGEDVFWMCSDLKEIKVPKHLKDEFYYDGTAAVIYY